MKVWNYVFISITMMLVLTFLGFETGFTQIFNLIGFSYTTETIGNSSVGIIGNLTTTSETEGTLYHYIFGSGVGILMIAIVGSLIVGFFTKQSTENIIILPLITTTLVLFVQTFVSIMNYSVGNFPTWASAVVITIFLPFTTGFIISLVEFFRASD